MWEAGGDFNNTLANAIRETIGLDDCVATLDNSNLEQRDYYYYDDEEEA